MLFVPGNKPELIQKAVNTKADAVIIDLEDSVVEKEKDHAREIVRSLLGTGIFDNKQIFIRLNDRDSGYLQKEVEEFTHKDILGFLYPKVYDEAELNEFDKLLTEPETKSGFPKDRFKVIPLIETTSAIMNIHSICNASSRIIAVAFGSEDYLSDLCGKHDQPEHAFIFPRSIIANAARSTGIIPIDTLNIDVHDLEKLENKLHLTRILGFEGSLLLHPKEIEMAHRYYTPTDEEVEQAKKIIELSKEIDTGNRSVAIVDDMFIGPPLVRSATKLLKRYELIQQIKEL